MNIYSLMLRKPRLSLIVTVNSMSAIGIVTFLLVFTTTVTANSKDEYWGRHHSDNRDLSEVQKREADNIIPVVDADSSKAIPPLNGGTAITPSSSSNTSTPTTPTLQTGPGLTQDKNMQDTLNCSLETNKENKTNCPDSHYDGDNGYFKSLKQQMIDNKDMLLRAMYVTLAITGIIVVYFVARTIWLRKRRTKSRKYRIIAQNGDQRDLEMEPLGDGNDDDEDYTVFELNGRKK